MRTPLVAIKCITYNQAQYIRQCLDGFVMQQTLFPFVAIVHDDASTDGTNNIIMEYAEKYPNVIIPIIETENQFSKHDGSINRIMTEACNNIGAKYIALCEGDDYWTDPLKLQKQVDFLESHPDYSMCFHRAKILNECNADTSYVRCEDVETKEYFANDMFPMWIVPTASVVYRSQLVNAYSIQHREWFMYGDIVLFETCAHVGRVWGMGDEMSIYRVNSSSRIQNPKSRIENIKKSATHFRALKINFPLLNADCLDELISRSYITLMKLSSSAIGKIKYLVLAIYYCPSFIFGKVTTKILVKR